MSKAYNHDASRGSGHVQRSRRKNEAVEMKAGRRIMIDSNPSEPGVNAEHQKDWTRLLGMEGTLVRTNTFRVAGT